MTDLGITLSQMEPPLLGISWYPRTDPREISKDQPLHLDMTQLGKANPVPELHGGFTEAPITSSQFNIFHCPAKLSSLLYRYCSAILNASSVYKLQNLFPGVSDLRQVHEPWFLHMWNSKQQLHYRVSMRIKWKTTCKALSVMPSSYNIQ